MMEEKVMKRRLKTGVVDTGVVVVAAAGVAAGGTGVKGLLTDLFGRHLSLVAVSLLLPGQPFSDF